MKLINMHTYWTLINRNLQYSYKTFRFNGFVNFSGFKTIFKDISELVANIDYHINVNYFTNDTDNNDTLDLFR